ncbi:ABC transporter ATP-binding protein [Paenibacillus validus]|uniref:ABC transporter ATP-binding protein n=1 Tax=Paenibacillus TaxID=44249 RepID=UPI000FD7FDB7|nr:ABC transporter ATP-binding protein [Paenibacillus validus]MED4599476.1 ABC transporter ATP-binding protein [Paenibacillus validus]MED4606728.1 ABC transporter ATP-binding protein [Paenibacillus validus]
MATNDIIIDVKDLTKIYKIYDHPKDRLKETLNPTGKKYHKEFAALNKISFQIGRGEAVGIIGKNGSGKSTLLKIITGVLTPSSGNIAVHGKVAALLELGAGFNPDLTGIENIYLNGTLMGYSKDEMDKKISEIISFADIGEFINQPVKMYSSGMFARLAFSVAINVDPDILIIDEALSVGDIYFQAKCIAKMKQLAEKSTILFVSHSMDSIKSFCNKGILLSKGEIVKIGEVKEVAQTYENMINQEVADMNKVKSLESFMSGESDVEKELAIENDLEFEARANQFRSGTGEAKFIRADLLVDGKISNIIPFGSTVTLRLIAKYYVDVDTEGTIGYMVRNHNGVDVFGMNIYNTAKLVPTMKSGQLLETNFTFKNLLSESGKYTVSIGLKPKPFEPLYFDNVSIAVVFEVPPIEKNYVPGLIFVENKIVVSIH